MSTPWRARLSAYSRTRPRPPRSTTPCGQLERVALAQLVEQRLLLARSRRCSSSCSRRCVTSARRPASSGPGVLRSPPSARRSSSRKRVVERRQVALLDLGDLDAEAAHSRLGARPRRRLLAGGVKLGLLAGREAGERRGSAPPRPAGLPTSTSTVWVGPIGSPWSAESSTDLDRRPGRRAPPDASTVTHSATCGAGRRAPRRPRQRAGIGVGSAAGRSPRCRRSSIGGRISTVATKISGSPRLELDVLDARGAAADRASSRPGPASSSAAPAAPGPRARCPS